MDNFRRPMYNRYNRNLGCYQNSPCNCGQTPVMDVRSDDRSDKDRRCMEKDMDRRQTGDQRCDEERPAMNLEDMPIAMAYVPFQKWRKVYDGTAGLEVGTIFQELVLPFTGDRRDCRMRGGRS